MPRIFMNMAQNLLARLRSLVGPKRWDYLIYWSLTDDQRCLEFIGCCCEGADQLVPGLQNPGCSESHGYFAVRCCRDVTIPHPKSPTCDLLAEFPSTFPIDSGLQGQVLLSGQPRWMSFPIIGDPNTGQERVQTRVLIPIRNSLIELSVSKPVAENPSIVQYILAECEAWLPQPQIFDNNNIFHNSAVSIGGFEATSEATAVGTLPWLAAAESHIQWDTDRNVSEPQLPISMTASHLNFLSQELGGHHQAQPPIQIMSQKPDLSESPHTSGLSKEVHTGEKASDFKQEIQRGDSSECSDHMEDDEDQKAVGRSGRRHLSKNLVAERKRRKKLNERLYALRALVPKITKMDRASILGDAIEYIKELQQQVKELQDELDEMDSLENTGQATQDDARCPSQTDVAKSAANAPPEDIQTMQIEVSQVDSHVFNLRIFSEKREGGFVRLLQAMDALGLDILNCNITSFRGLVLNVFNAETRDKEALQAEQLRETLLEMTLNPELIRSCERATTEQHHQ